MDQKYNNCINIDNNKDIDFNKNIDILDFIKAQDNITVIEIKNEDDIKLNIDTKLNHEKGSEKKNGKIEFSKQFLLPKVYTIGILSSLAMIGFSNVYCKIFKLNLISNKNELFELFKSEPFFSSIIICILSPLIEELVCRRMIFAFVRRYSKILAYVLSTVIFTFGNFDFSYKLFWEEKIFIPIYFINGIILAFAYDYDNCILASIIANIIYNISIIMKFISAL